MNNITITIKYDTAVELMLALDAMRDTGNKEFDERMTEVYEKLKGKI